MEDKYPVYNLYVSLLGSSTIEVVRVTTKAVYTDGPNLIRPYCFGRHPNYVIVGDPNRDIGWIYFIFIKSPNEQPPGAGRAIYISR